MIVKVKDLFDIKYGVNFELNNYNYKTLLTERWLSG